MMLFITAMLLRLVEKHEKGWTGWDNETDITDDMLENKLRNNLENADYVDVAVYAGFLWILSNIITLSNAVRRIKCLMNYLTVKVNR